MKGPRFAEETFPMKEISELSSREKSGIRHGHISSLHTWWARRPLTSSRAINYACLVPIPIEEKEIQRKKEFIIALSKWENSSNKALIDKAVRDIMDANDGKVPRILDPFAGGGAIPLEALRLGCETYASDYNPVATLILKCTLQYPQAYAKRNIDPEIGLVNEEKNLLIGDVKKYANIVLNEVEKDIGKYFITEKGNRITVDYLWARIIPCQNPSCNSDIPLLRQYWLVKRNDKMVYLYPEVYNKTVNFKIAGTGHADNQPKGFDPEKGTVSRAVATCLVCGSVVDNKTTSKLFREQKSAQRLVAVVLYNESKAENEYRVARDDDVVIYNEAKKYLETKTRTLQEEIGLNPIPDEPTPEGRGRGAERAFSIRNYGINSWGDLFNDRQKLVLITFVEKIRNLHKQMTDQGYNDDYAKCITTYLAFAVSKMADYNNMMCQWIPQIEKVGHLFARQAIPIHWDYIEVNPMSGSTGTWKAVIESIVKVVDHLSKIPSAGHVSLSSVTSLSYPNSFFDAVFTDPPYYDNVPYSHLSDFFYVWLKRTLGDIYPELFSTPLTPKSKEIVAYGNIEGGFEAGKRHFEVMLKKSFQEIGRVLKPNGIAVIVYAHKSTAGWETLINALIDSGLVVNAAWPINTERSARLRASESAALASSIYMIARKYLKTEIGFYRNIKSQLKKHLDYELDKLWKEGVSGADFLISAIGSAIEVFGIYEKIIDDEGNEIRADKLLEQIRAIVTDYAVKQVLHNGFVEEITQMTRLYVLWRWAYGESKIPFDDARKLAQSVGIDLTKSWNKGFIQKDKEFIRILGPSDRSAKDITHSTEMIDVLHQVLLFWNKGKSSEIVPFLKDSKFGKSDVFYRVAQAISESLPNESKEKKWIEGLLIGKSRISEELKVESGQRRLFE